MTDMQTPLAGLVKPLEWEVSPHNDKCIAETQFKIVIKVEEYYSGGFHVLWSAPGYSDSFTAGLFPTLEAAQSAAQADYTARIASALNPDAILALVAAAYADAADKCGAHSFSNNYFVSKSLGDASTDIRARTPTDATAALARMLAEARDEGRKEALGAIAAIPTPATEDQARGHEDAYRAVEAMAMKGGQP